MARARSFSVGHFAFELLAPRPAASVKLPRPISPETPTRPPSFFFSEGVATGRRIGDIAALNSVEPGSQSSRVMTGLGETFGTIVPPSTTKEKLNGTYLLALSFDVRMHW